MRLFIALDIDDPIRRSIARFMDGVRNFAPDVRWVRPESLHITLKFIGEKSPELADQIKVALSTVVSPPVTVTLRGYGFFPTARSPRVFWIGIEAGPELSNLAVSIDKAMDELGIPPEQHSFHPHLTLARGGSGSGSPRRQKGDRQNSNFQLLQEKLAALPPAEFGTMTAREFFLYQSKLGPGGAQYYRLQGFPLRGRQ
jgi:RNA 2',3'-cyclic 3'-phosphodiesterase